MRPRQKRYSCGPYSVKSRAAVSAGPAATGACMPTSAGLSPFTVRAKRARAQVIRPVTRYATAKAIAISSATSSTRQPRASAIVRISVRSRDAVALRAAASAGAVGGACAVETGGVSVPAAGRHVATGSPPPSASRRGGSSSRRRASATRSSSCASGSTARTASVARSPRRPSHVLTANAATWPSGSSQVSSTQPTHPAGSSTVKPSQLLRSRSVVMLFVSPPGRIRCLDTGCQRAAARPHCVPMDTWGGDPERARHDVMLGQLEELKRELREQELSLMRAELARRLDGADPKARGRRRDPDLSAKERELAAAIAKAEKRERGAAAELALAQAERERLEEREKQIHQVERELAQQRVALEQERA